MNRTEALKIAAANLKANDKARIDFTFGRTQSYNEKDYGYLHGWFKVGEFCFSREEITGQAYDHNQGGWAFI